MNRTVSPRSAVRLSLFSQGAQARGVRKATDLISFSTACSQAAAAAAPPWLVAIKEVGVELRCDLRENLADRRFA